MKKLKPSYIACECLALSIALASLVLAASTAAQTSPADGPWTGQVVCQLNLQSQGYTRQETQTWTITNGASKAGPGAGRLFPATWVVTGTGSVQKTQNGQTFTAQWTTNVPPSNGSISVFVRASDGQLIFRQGHSQMRNDLSLRGMRQAFWNGQQQQPAAVAHPTWEWVLPWMQADPNDPSPSGTFSVTAEALPAELNNPPDLSRIATCNWHFSRGGAGSNPANSSNPAGNAPGATGPPAQSPTSSTQSNSGCLRSAADIVQSFTSMKADVEQQFDRLIREATDPATAQSLQTQKQKTLSDLSAQEQRDLQASANGCPPGSQTGGTQTSNGGSSSSGTGNYGTPTGNQGTGGSTQGAQNNGSGSVGTHNNTSVTGTPGSGAAQTNGGPGAATGSSSMIAPDGNEPNDSFNMATNLGTLGPGTTRSVQANLHSAVDRDFYQFALLPGTQATVALTASSPGTNFALNQYHSDFSLAGSTATGAGTTANFSAASGSSITTVIIEVRANSWNASSPNYSLNISATGATGTPNNSNPGTNTNTPINVLPGQVSKQISSPPAIKSSLPPKLTTTPTKTGTQSTNGSATQTAAPASGNYLVTIAGLICVKAASNNDAVYPAAFIHQYDRRSGQSTMTTEVQTWVYGDVNGMINQRKQAGSISPTGGIRNGDMIPPGFVPGIPSTLPPQVNLFPLNAWQGTLTDGVDAVLISPSVWLNYGDTPMLQAWVSNQESFTNSLLLDSSVQNQINSQTLGTLFLGPSANATNQLQNITSTYGNDIAATSISALFAIPPFLLAFNHPTHDRPYGLADAGTGPTAAVVLPNATIVLTREIIEKALGTRSWTTVVIDLKDTTKSFNALPGSDRPGEYSMFVIIQRQ